MKTLLRTAAVAFVVLIVLALAVVIGVNAFDENLTPQAASYGEPRSPTVPGAENGYYALLGLGAPDGARESRGGSSGHGARYCRPTRDDGGMAVSTG